MLKKATFFILLFFLLSLSPYKLLSQNYEKTRILFLLDASGSMLGKWDKNMKIDVAKKLLTEMADSLDKIPDVEIGLRVYGHRSHRAKQDCRDTRLEVPFGPESNRKIKDKLKEIKPQGTTPIAYSLQEAAGDFPRDPTSKNVIILLTDGIEECGGDPCAISMALQKRNVVLKPFVIGLGDLEKYKKHLDCIGRFYNAESERDLGTILNLVIKNTLNETTAQVFLLNSEGKPTETDVAMSFYDRENNIVKSNFYHTMNRIGVPDTLYLDPSTKYSLEIHTIPSVFVREVEIIPAEHNIIRVNTPQGSLKVNMPSRVGTPGPDVVIKKRNDCEILNIQKINTSHKYLEGNYDIEVHTLPVSTYKNINIRQDNPRIINIPDPGRLSVYTSNPTLGSIYIEKNGRLIWVTDTDPSLRREVIYLQPGDYRIISRPKSSRNIYKTDERQVKILSNGSININL